MTRLLGLDIGGTKSAVILGNDRGEVLAREQFASDATRGPAAMIDDVLAQVATVRQKAAAPIAAVGVSIGGPLDAPNGIIHSPPNLPGWDGVPLKALLEEKLGLPVVVAHDAAACALVEYRWGAGQGADRLCYLTCGTGFGVGVILHGQPYYGAGGASIEIGHVRYREDGPTAFGKQGCFEAWCAGSSLPKLAALFGPPRFQTVPPDGRTLMTLAQQGDTDAQHILALNARATGAACALLGDLLVPNMILLGSLAQYLGPTWVDQVRGTFETEVLPSVAATCRIAAASLGPRLQDCSALAAATLALSKT